MIWFSEVVFLFSFCLKFNSYRCWEWRSGQGLSLCGDCWHYREPQSDYKEYAPGRYQHAFAQTDTEAFHNTAHWGFYKHCSHKRLHGVRPQLCQKPKLCDVCYVCRLHGIDGFLQLIRSQYQMPHFQLECLEKDFMLTFVAGKPLIESPSLLRKVFKFKKHGFEK